MYFNFDDLRPDTPTIEPAITHREAALFSVVVHLGLLFLIVAGPNLPFVREWSAAAEAARQEAFARRLEAERDQVRRFVFVSPRADIESLKPPPVTEESDRNRVARAPERAVKPENSLPFSRGNTPERVEEVARGEPPRSEQMPGVDNDSASGTSGDRLEELASRESERAPLFARGPTAGQSGGSLGEALRNLQRYVQGDNFANQEGGADAWGPSIQFDTKGVEFGPWIRRFVAQIKRNWFIPYAAMAMKGHVVITFNVARDGTISDLNVVGPCPIEAFNHAAFNALVASNPTQTLPPEYPSDHVFFTVTFYYNEVPPQ